MNGSEEGKGFVTRGDVCPKCGYTFRKWAVRCPQCRTRVSTPVNEKKQLGELARRFLRKLEESKEPG